MLGVLFLSTKTKNNRANVFLAFFMLSLSFEVLEVLLNMTSLELTFWFQASLLSIPTLYYYVQFTLNQRIPKISYLLLSPFLLSPLIPTSNFIYYILNIPLLFYILHLINQHQTTVKDFYSTTHLKTLKWIRTLVYVYLLFHALWVLEDMISLISLTIPELMSEASTYFTLLMIYWIGVNGFSQPELFSSLDTMPASEPVISSSSNDSEILDNSANSIDSEFETIVNSIKERKLFLQQDLSIRSLAKQLSINERVLSQLIKSNTDKNFHYFINQFRVEEFKTLLKTEKINQMSLLGLSEEAGFTSKSTFYAVFKQHEGMTPKQYLDALK